MKAYDLVFTLWNDIYFTVFPKAKSREDAINCATCIIFYFYIATKNPQEFSLSIEKFLKKTGIKDLKIKDEIYILYRKFYKEKISLEKQGVKVGTQNHIKLIKIESECFLENKLPQENEEYNKLFELEHGVDLQGRKYLV